jgi:hypothetical protein
MIGREARIALDGTVQHARSADPSGMTGYPEAIPKVRVAD